MKHDFQANADEVARCLKCGYHEIDHTDRATCESCGNTGTCDFVVTGFLQCMDCIAKDAAVENVNDKGLMQGPLAIAMKPDQTIIIAQDIFNAKIATINELKLAIDADTSIENKHFTLAKTLEERFKHLKQVFFDLSEQTKDNLNEQRALQTYYNDLAKKLREEERAQIKMQDVNYQPVQPKLVKPKAPKIQKVDRQQVRLFAASSGIPEQAIQGVCLARGVTAEQAVKILKDLGM